MIYCSSSPSCPLRITLFPGISEFVLCALMIVLFLFPAQSVLVLSPSLVLSVSCGNHSSVYLRSLCHVQTS